MTIEERARQWLQRMDSRFQSESFRPNDVLSLAAAINDAVREALKEAAALMTKLAEEAKTDDLDFAYQRGAEAIRALRAKTGEPVTGQNFLRDCPDCGEEQKAGEPCPERGKKG